ncbi:unnamed protein product [Sympodiomycopsis kandeliae]
MAPKRKAPTTNSDAKADAKGKKAAKGNEAVPNDIEATIPMGKSLASTEKKTRDAAIRSLSQYLSHKAGADPLSPLESAKLWKGIFYCFWMSDKPVVQHELALELAELLLVVQNPERVPAPIVEGFEDSVGDITISVRSGLSLLEGFWDAMIREWIGLDKWRIDKFYSLIRKFVCSSFRLLISESFDRNAVAHYSRILTKPGGVLDANDPKVPDSMTYHFTDVFLGELETALRDHGTEQKVQASLAEQAEGGEKGSSSKKASRTTASKKETKSRSEEEIRREVRGLQNSPDLSGPIFSLLQPIFITAATCHSKTVYKKIMENIFEPLDRDLIGALGADGEHSATNFVDRRRAREEGLDLPEYRKRMEAGEYDSACADDEIWHPNEHEAAYLDADAEDQELMLSEQEFPEITQSSAVSPKMFRQQLFKIIFDAASRQDALAPNRRKMYGLWQAEKDRREEEEESDAEYGP